MLLMPDRFGGSSSAGALVSDDHSLIIQVGSPQLPGEQLSNDNVCYIRFLAGGLTSAGPWSLMATACTAWGTCTAAENMGGGAHSRPRAVNRTLRPSTTATVPRWLAA